jgi:hypothetical protein
MNRKIHPRFWRKALSTENDAPGYRLNDFKMGFLEVNATYTLFKK